MLDVFRMRIESKLMELSLVAHDVKCKVENTMSDLSETAEQVFEAAQDALVDHIEAKLDETLEVFEKLESELGIPDSEFSVQPGDVIGIDRGLYYHYGIYLGGQRVIHYTLTWSSKIVTPAHSIKPLWQQPVLDHH